MIVEIVQSESISKERWAEGMWHLHRQFGAMAEKPSSILVSEDTKRLRCGWDDSVASVPTEQDISNAADSEESRRSDIENNLSNSTTALINNADLLRQAMSGITEARSALDSAIPIDNSTNATALNSLARRQAAVLYLAANALRASAVLSERGELPDDLVKEFA